jgi:hypothetical protein
MSLNLLEFPHAGFAIIVFNEVAEIIVGNNFFPFGSIIVSYQNLVLIIVIPSFVQVLPIFVNTTEDLCTKSLTVWLRRHQYVSPDVERFPIQWDRVQSILGFIISILEKRCGYIVLLLPNLLLPILHLKKIIRIKSRKGWHRITPLAQSIFVVGPKEKSQFRWDRKGSIRIEATVRLQVSLKNDRPMEKQSCRYFQ